MLSGCSALNKSEQYERELEVVLIELEQEVEEKEATIAEKETIIKQKKADIKKLSEEIAVQPLEIELLNDKKADLIDKRKEEKRAASIAKNDPALDLARNYVLNLELFHQDIEAIFHEGLKEPDKDWIITLVVTMPSYYGVLMREDFEFLTEIIWPDNDYIVEDIESLIQKYNDINSAVLKLDDTTSPGPETEEAYQFSYDEIQKYLDQAAEMTAELKNNLSM